ncbi:uncharacterized protein [Linepithema humile]|uniref:uncharacterized protein isoform X2 n=1 Tax=Linepithema humile TaxID=83485 RepID=UPI00351E56F5
MLRNKRKRLKRLQNALLNLSMAWNLFMITSSSLLEELTKVNRRWWVRPVHFDQEKCGHYQNLFNYLLNEDNELFYQDYRMSVEQYKTILAMVQPHLQKFSKRTPHPPGLRLALTLSFLAHGDSVNTTARGFRIGKSTAYKIIFETCNVIWNVLQPIYLPKPTADSWRRIAEDFYEIWNFPNCIGAVDGKHIQIQCPPKTGSLYYNYKQFFSIVLMAAADAKYKFTWVDIGDYGSMSDGGIWAESAFGSALEEGSVDLPLPRLLPNSNIMFPHFFVGDEAFPLKMYMMRPYPKKDLCDRRRYWRTLLPQ